MNNKEGMITLLCNTNVFRSATTNYLI